MKFSRKTEYAIRALIAMARKPGTSRVPEISKEEGIPEKFLEQIFLSLRHAGILASRRGVGGGYSFHIPPDALDLASVIRAIEGPTAPLPCAADNLTGQCACEDPARCPIRPVMAELRDAIDRFLSARTVGDLARAARGPESLHYDI